MNISIARNAQSASKKRVGMRVPIAFAVRTATMNGATTATDALNAPPVTETTAPIAERAIRIIRSAPTATNAKTAWNKTARHGAISADAAWIVQLRTRIIAPSAEFTSTSVLSISDARHAIAAKVVSPARVSMMIIFVKHARNVWTARQKKESNIVPSAINAKKISQ